MITDSNQACLAKMSGRRVQEERDLSIIRLEQIEIVLCSMNNAMNQVSSVRNTRLLPPYLIRGRNDNLSNHNALLSLRGAVATWQSRL
jgi:hypothetical protein